MDSKGKTRFKVNKIEDVKDLNTNNVQDNKNLFGFQSHLDVSHNRRVNGDIIYPYRQLPRQNKDPIEKNVEDNQLALDDSKNFNVVQHGGVNPQLTQNQRSVYTTSSQKGSGLKSSLLTHPISKKMCNVNFMEEMDTVIEVYDQVDNEEYYRNMILKTKNKSRYAALKNKLFGALNKSKNNDETFINIKDTMGLYHENYDKTFAKHTSEAVPDINHYRNTQNRPSYIERPTIEELHLLTNKPEPEKELVDETEETIETEKRKKSIVSKKVQFGWIQGVLMRCLLNIWGVILFIRVPWIVGQAGILLTIVIILLSSVVTILTTISMSAISTNGNVKEGGIYYLISRTLGPNFGGPIGINFSLASSIASAMYIVGFAETISDVSGFDEYMGWENPAWSVRLFGASALILLHGISLMGMKYESKTQFFFMFILVGSMVNFIIGSFMNKQKEEIILGLGAYSLKTFYDNLLPQFCNGVTFGQTFAIFFPAATGILAGANISGDLKDPQKSIPKGTFFAILISTFTYIIIVLIIGAITHRIFPIDRVDYICNLSIDQYEALGNKDVFGLTYYIQIMQKASAVPFITVFGICAATLSSALASLVAAPKVFEVVCRDELFPGIVFFSDKDGRKYSQLKLFILNFLISVACVAIGNLNVIAGLISNFFLMAYTLINYACFDASNSKMPGWRPSFRFYNRWTSLLGAALCLSMMFILQWYTALATILLIMIFYYYVSFRKPDVNWGSSSQANVYKNALQYSIQLNNIESHIKTYRPQFLIFCKEKNLVDSTHLFLIKGITGTRSLLVYAHVIIEPDELNMQQSKCLLKNKRDTVHKDLSDHLVKGFKNIIIEESFKRGAQHILQLSGLGNLQPNVAVLKMRSNWTEKDILVTHEYCLLIRYALFNNYGLGIMDIKNPNSLRLYEDIDSEIYDKADKMSEESSQINSSCDQNEVISKESETSSFKSNPHSDVEQPNKKSSSIKMKCELNGNKNDKDGDENLNEIKRISTVSNVSKGSTDTKDSKISRNSKNSNSTRGNKDEIAIDMTKKKFGKPNNRIIKKIVSNWQQFYKTKGKKGTIDIWWLFDDGGLTLLISYILANRRKFISSKLRIFFVTNKIQTYFADKMKMIQLLEKFRIKYYRLHFVHLCKLPGEDKMREFKDMLDPFYINSNNKNEIKNYSKSIYTYKSQYILFLETTNRLLRLSEMVTEICSNSSLCIITLPIFKENMPSTLYISWLSLICKSAPNVFLLRGNQDSVLTFYS